MQQDLYSSQERPWLQAATIKYPELMFVNDALPNPKVPMCGETMDLKEMSEKARGAWEGGCLFDMHDLCRFKHQLISAAGPYTGRLKYTMLCGSPVIVVRYRQGVSEFYESVMTPGVHYLLAESPEEVPGIIRELKRNESWARVAFWAATFFFVRALEVPTAGSAAASVVSKDTTRATKLCLANIRLHFL